MDVWNLIFYAIVAAIIFTMVRPGSKSGQAVAAVTNAFAGMVAKATGATA
ncbi:hypothetical protein [Amycolatopsis alkalitolerans]|nr:hypothetical protein [Amycolatopsis alkalitolerans]